MAPPTTAAEQILDMISQQLLQFTGDERINQVLIFLLPFLGQLLEQENLDARGRAYLQAKIDDALRTVGLI